MSSRPTASRLAQTLLNLAGSALESAWSAGEIDGAFCGRRSYGGYTLWLRHPTVIRHAISTSGAFCWGSAYNLLRATPGAVVLLSAQAIGNWGKPTFVPLTYRRGFRAAHPDIVRHIVAVIALLQDSWLGRDTGDDAVAWSDMSRTGYLASVTNMVGELNITATNNEATRTAMGEFEFASSEAMMTCAYVGAGGCSATERALPVATKSTAEWQRYFKFIVQTKPTGKWWDVHTEADIAEHFSRAYNGSALALARADIAAGSISLATLDARSAAAFPATARVDGGDSTCRNTTAMRVGPGSGAINDGAGGRAGRSYSDGITCCWVIAAASASDVVALDFGTFRVWSGDYVTVTGADGALVALLSGFNRTWPRLVALGGMNVSCATDGRSETAYNLPIGDGFAARYDTAAAGCASDADCGGVGACAAATGLCVCDAGYGGADCSYEFCLGTQTRAASSSGTFASGVGALNATHRYPNDADCTFIVEVPSGFAFVQFTLSYDVEEAYDYVEVNATSSDAVP